MNTPKPIVAYYSNTFFVKSETFIRHYLANLTAYKPICIAWNIHTLPQFSFPDSDLYNLQLPKYSPKWFWNGIMKKLLGRSPLFEAIVKKNNPKIIHAHFGHNGVQALQLKHHLNIPLITTFYGADLSKYEVINTLKEKYNKLFTSGQLFLVEGLHMKEKLCQLGCPKEKIQIQRIAIPIHHIHFKKRTPKSNKTIKFIFCGRFTEKKGLIYALKALKKVKDDRSNYKFSFCIIGDGRQKDEINRFIVKNKMETVVELPGFLNYQQYLKRMEDADIFIHPSITAPDGDTEGGAPTTILEAQAMGFPIISTYHADIPNIVVPGKSALLSKEKDVDGLYQNIITLIENPDLWQTMGKTGREFVEEFHDIRKEVLKLEEKYRQLEN